MVEIIGWRHLQYMPYLVGRAKILRDFVNYRRSMLQSASFTCTDFYEAHIRFYSYRLSMDGIGSKSHLD